jgi:hypothetical protein
VPEDEAVSDADDDADLAVRHEKALWVEERGGDGPFEEKMGVRSLLRQA